MLCDGIVVSSVSHISELLVCFLLGWFSVNNILPVLSHTLPWDDWINCIIVLWFVSEMAVLGLSKRTGILAACWAGLVIQLLTNRCVIWHAWLEVQIMKVGLSIVCVFVESVWVSIALLSLPLEGEGGVSFSSQGPFGVLIRPWLFLKKDCCSWKKTTKNEFSDHRGPLYAQGPLGMCPECQYGRSGLDWQMSLFSPPSTTWRTQGQNVTLAMWLKDYSQHWELFETLKSQFKDSQPSATWEILREAAGKTKKPKWLWFSSISSALSICQS